MPASTGSNGGIDWTIELDRADLIPGRLVAGRVRLVATHAVTGRGVVVTLRGEERWKYEVTTTTGETTTTTVHTGTQQLPPNPVRVAGPVSLAVGEALDLPFELPAPPLGPPTVECDVAGVRWWVEAKLDREGFDASIEVPVRVLQPTALLRAGVVHVGQFALFDVAAGDRAGDLGGSIALDPVPLVAGAPFSARVRLGSPSGITVRSIRGELKVKATVTVGGGLHQEVVAWRGVIAGPSTVQGNIELACGGSLDAAVPPTTELPHATIQARFEVILDIALARDHRLGRDVAVAGTAEV